MIRTVLKSPERFVGHAKQTRLDMYGQHVASRSKLAGDVKAAGMEGVVVLADFLSVERDARGEVEPLENQPDGGSFENFGGRVEFLPVDPTTFLDPARLQRVQPKPHVVEDARAFEIEMHFARHLRRKETGRVHLIAL